MAQPSSESLRLNQIGPEATAGTAVPATSIMRQTAAAIRAEEPVTHPNENIGTVMPTDRSYKPFKLAHLSEPDHEATFEQILYNLSAGINNATPAADGAGDGYIYNYLWPVAAMNTPKTYTIEAGDEANDFEMEYSFIESFTISADAQGAWQISAEWTGRQRSSSTFTTGLSAPSVEEILFQNTKLSIDAIGGTMGNTAITTTLLGFALTVTTGFTPRFSGDGELYFSRLAKAVPDVSLDVTFGYDSQAVAQDALRIAQTARMIRLEALGTAFSTGGTDHANKTARIDSYGKWSNFSDLGARDGENIITGTFKPAYNATEATAGGILICTDLAAIP